MKSTVKYTSGQSCYICTRRQKVFAWFVLIGIFVCGMMTGVSLWGYKHAHTADSGVYEKSGIRKYVESRVKFTKRCQELEDTLLRQIDDNNYDKNIRIYQELADKGCEENRQQFAELVAREQIRYNAVLDLSKINPCKEIEKILTRSVHTDCNNYYSGVYKCHLDNAEIYSKLTDAGCSENADLYKSKALAELEIVEGLRGDNEFIDDDEVRTTVTTYKKLQMQNEAKKYLQKAEKLINPGVDFIMELQRVIEE